MRLRERIAKALFGGVIQEEVRKSSRQVIAHLTGLSTSEGVLPGVDFEVYNQMYEQTSWVRAVVGVICKAVTARGYSLAPLKPQADPRNAEALSEFFSNCNPNDTFLEILDDITRDDYVFGNAFLEVVRGADGKPRELWNLDATTMRVKADEHGAILGYLQSPRYAVGKADRVEFAPNEVLHFKLGTKGATLYGLSPLASLILPVTVDRFAQVYNRAFFVNGAKIRGAFIMKDATPEQVERNREYLVERAKNPDMAHSDLVLEGQIEFKQIGTTQKDMEFLELREFTRNEILAVYGVPPSKVSIIETGNIGGGTGEHQTQTFYEETIQPFQTLVAEKITKHIIRQGFGITDWAFQFNKRPIDEKEQAEIFNIYLQAGVFTAEEIRRLVAPRMPEMQKSLEVRKGKLGLQETIVNGTRTVVDIENRFLNAMERLFRDMRRRIAADLPKLNPEVIVPKLAQVVLPFETFLVPHRKLIFERVKFPEQLKALDELEIILESVDEEEISRVILRFTTEAARKGSKLSARRADVEEPEDIGQDLEEALRANAHLLGLQVAESLKDTLRRAVLEGLAAHETIPQLMRRVGGELDSARTVDVRGTVDRLGRERPAHARKISRDALAEMIARSESSRALNQGFLDTLRKSGFEKVRWLLASDACEKCVAAAEVSPGEKLGRVMPIDEAE
ncbi:MAG: phage portal protein [Elusimicrobia bacterium]|nr:phage portal protein [Elusimicrobiota bacterium]